MGPDESVPSQGKLLQGVNRQAFPSTTYVVMDGKQIEEFNANPDDDAEAMRMTAMYRMPYSGVWSVTMPVGRGPSPRTGHFCCYSEEMHTAFIGYGMKRSGKLLSDVWALDTEDYTWRKLKLTGASIEPRVGATAQMMGNYIVVFGGYSDPHYFADLHTIDVTTGEVLKSDTRGIQPPAMAEAVFAIYNQKLYMWGGYNGLPQSELHILDFTQMRWSTKQTGVEGRMGAAYAVVDHRLFIYGAAEDQPGFVIVDMDNNTVAVTPTTGAAPPTAVTNAGMVKVDNFLFFFGGKSKNKWTMVYACDIERLWWFVFFITPDGETTSQADGKISSDGLFLLPRINSFSTIYVPERRQILAFLGHPHKNPTPLFIVDVADALTFLHLRDDMKAMFQAVAW